MPSIELDLHTHTIASGHGSASTITDMAKPPRFVDYVSWEFPIMDLLPSVAENLPISAVFPRHAGSVWAWRCFTERR